MDFGANETPVETFGEGALEVLILKTFTLVLLKRDTKCRGKNSIS